MRRAILILSIGVSAALGQACGGSSSPSTPSTPRVAATPATEAPVVVDGWTDQPVAAEVTPPTVGFRNPILVSAEGYLPREQLFVREPVHLWPAEEAYVRELVYWEFTDGSFRMVRWDGPFTVTLDGGLFDDLDVVAKTQGVVEELVRRTRLPITLGPGGSCTIKIDPSIIKRDAVATAQLSFQGSTIVGATVSFVGRREILGRGRADWANTLLHEMGHVVGLRHSPDPHDVMTPGAGPGTGVEHFVLNEAIALHIMYNHRSAGNRPPDRDPQVAAASTATPRLTVIID